MTNSVAPLLTEGFKSGYQQITKNEFKDVCLQDAQIRRTDSEVFVTLPIVTAQCLKVDLIDSTEKTLASKSRSVTADRCEFFGVAIYVLLDIRVIMDNDQTGNIPG